MRSDKLARRDHLPQRVGGRVGRNGAATAGAEMIERANRSDAVRADEIVLRRSRHGETIASRRDDVLDRSLVVGEHDRFPQVDALELVAVVHRMPVSR